MPEGQGQVRVELRAQGDGYLVRVEDNGPGVPQPYREAIFEKFRQVSGSGSMLKDKPKGTGLGLAICRQIVEHFGGRIWAEDAALGGAAICFTLPAAQTARPARRLSTRRTQKPTGCRPNFVLRPSTVHCHYF